MPERGINDLHRDCGQKMRKRRKSCAAKSMQDESSVVGRIRRMIRLKISVEDNKICNTEALRERGER